MDLFFRFFKASLRTFTLNKASVTIPGMREIFSSPKLKTLHMKKVKVCYIAEKSTRESGPPTHIRNRGWEKFIDTIVGKPKRKGAAASPDTPKKLRFGAYDAQLKKVVSEKAFPVSKRKSSPSPRTPLSSILPRSATEERKLGGVSFANSRRDKSDDDDDEDTSDSEKVDEERGKKKEASTTTSTSEDNDDSTNDDDEGHHEDDDEDDDDDEEEEGMGKLDKILPKIRSFVLCQSKIEDPAYVEVLFKRLPSALQDLSLAGCASISDKMLFAICMRFPSLHSLKYVIAYKYILSHTHSFTLSLHIYSVSHANISDLSGSTLATRLPKLQKLNVSRCTRLTSVFLLQSFTALKELNIKGCKEISDFGLSFLVKKSPLLEVLDLTECTMITGTTINLTLLPSPFSYNIATITGASLEKLCKLKNLLRVHLFGTGRLYEESITKLVSHASTIRWLDLQRHVFVDPALCAFIKRSCPNLEVLDVRGCNVKDQNTLEGISARGRLIEDF